MQIIGTIGTITDNFDGDFVILPLGFYINFCFVDFLQFFEFSTNHKDFTRTSVKISKSIQTVNSSFLVQNINSK